MILPYSKFHIHFVLQSMFDVSFVRFLSFSFRTIVVVEQDFDKRTCCLWPLDNLDFLHASDIPGCVTYIRGNFAYALLRLFSGLSSACELIHKYSKGVPFPCEMSCSVDIGFRLATTFQVVLSSDDRDHRCT